MCACFIEKSGPYRPDKDSNKKVIQNLSTIYLYRLRSKVSMSMEVQIKKDRFTKTSRFFALTEGLITGPILLSRECPHPDSITQ